MRGARAAFFFFLLWSAGGLPAGSTSASDRTLPSATPAPPRPETLYSIRARRRAQALLRLRLLEMREAGLERVRAVIERRLPIDSLFDPVPGASPRAGEH
jgi:hypothetical protein